MNTGARPFVKWAGGKTQLLPELLKRVPQNYGTYHEVFLGGGAIFFALRPKTAILSDANQELVAAYHGVQQLVGGVVELLDLLFSGHSSEQYANVRAQDPGLLQPAERAARFIYLNKTCFNGLYRVNGKGKFNVPIGKFATPPRCDVDNLRSCSEALASAEIALGDFRQSLKRCAAGDFVYLDPPYVPASSTANFTGYTAGGFGPSDQVALADLVADAKSRGCHVLLSNADTEDSVKLYESRGLKVEHVLARRNINSKADKRGAVGEILVS